MITGHGNNLYHFDKGAIRADFSSNIAFNHKAKRISDYLREQMELIENYPDPEARELTALLAARHQVAEENILVTNGSAEAFYLIAHYLSRAEGGKQTRILTPSFAEYEDSCRLHEHDITHSDIAEFAALDLSNTNSLWLGVPNNPNGYRVSDADILRQCEANPHCQFVLDCAYHELSKGSEFAVDVIENQIITHSLTKSFGIPGIRLGYIIAKATTIAHLQEMRPPWSVNALSLAAGCFILKYYDELLFDHAELMAESQYLQEQIARIAGLELMPSGCNFFLARVTDGRDATQLQDYLIAEHGLLIRHAGNFQGLSDKHFRIAAQSREKNDQLITALRTWSSIPH